MSELQPHVQLVNMSRWYVVSRAIHTVAQLGLANHMSLEPKPINDLAKATGTKPELLERLMNFLTAYQIFHKKDDAYSLTDLSKPLRDDDPHSIRAVLCMVDDAWWQAFSHMDKVLQTGKSGFFHQHDNDFFNFLSQSPERQHNFDQGMAKLSTYDDHAIAKAFDYGKYPTIVDMGGGRGGLARAIAKHYPQVQIILFDTPSVIDGLDSDDFPRQISFIKGDFLKDIPKASLYLFKGVLHDFSDALMNQILNNCHQRMSKDAHLLIAEQVQPEEPGPHPNKTMDIVMMMLLAGRQRTLPEWEKAIARSGFHFQKAYKTESIFTVIHAQP